MSFENENLNPQSAPEGDTPKAEPPVESAGEGPVSSIPGVENPLSQPGPLPTPPLDTLSALDTAPESPDATDPSLPAEHASEENAEPTAPPEPHAPQWEQSPPPPASDPAPLVPAPGGELVASPPKTNKTPLLVLGAIAVLAVVAVVLLLVFVFGGNRPPNKEKDPGGYITYAIEKTTDNISASRPIFINLDKFADKPSAVDFDIDLDISELIYYSPMSNVNVNGTWKSNPSLQQYLLDVSVTSGIFNARDNRFYFTPEVVAISLPTLITKAEYITFDPRTLEEDIENSDFSYMFYGMPTSSLSAVADAEQMVAAQEAFMLSMTTYWADLQADADYVYEGTVSETVGGSRKTVDTMTITYSASSMQRFYDKLLDAFYEYLVETDYAPLRSSGYSYYTPEEMAVDMMDSLAQLEFRQPATVRYTINEDVLVTGFELMPYTLQVYDTYWDEYVGATFAIKLDMNGEGNLLNDARFSMDVQDDDGDNVLGLVLTNRHSESGDAINDRVEMIVYDEWDDEYRIVYELEWNPSNTDDRNMRMSLSMTDDYWTDITFRLTGNLTETGDELTLKNGKITVYDEDTDVFSIDVSYRLYAIPNEDLGIDLSDSVNLFDLSERELYDLVS